MHPQQSNLNHILVRSTSGAVSMLAAALPGVSIGVVCVCVN